MRLKAFSSPSVSSLFAASLALAALPSLGGCEVVLGISGHDSKLAALNDASLDGADGGDVGDAPSDHVDEPEAPATCVLPSTGDSLLRFTNVVPSTGKVDLCLTPSGGGAAIGPVFASSGGACPAGAGYKDSSILFSVPAGSYDIAFVPSGKPCTAAVAIAPHVTLEASAKTNAVLMGDGVGTPIVRLFKQSVPSSVSATKFRFINAISGDTLDYGIADSAATKISKTISTAVAFGATSPPGSTSFGLVDTNGYLELQGAGATFSLAYQLAGTTQLVAVNPLKLDQSFTYTSYAVGRANDVRFPPELLNCNEATNDKFFARCARALPIQLTVDALNAYVTGVFGPLDPVREKAFGTEAALSHLAADVVCLDSVWGEKLKAAVIKAASKKYSNSAQVHTDESTPATDPTDQAGKLPVPRTTPACQDLDKTHLHDMLKCFSDHCAVTPGDPTSTLFPDAATCMSTLCVDSILTLVSTNDASKRCWSCALTHLFQGKQFAEAENDCTTDPTWRYTWDGTNGAVLLSRLPILETEFISLPSTEWRVGFLRAAIQLDGGAVIDVYCGETTSPYDSPTRPYTGDYGGVPCADKSAKTYVGAGGVEYLCPNDASGAFLDNRAWRNELRLQVAHLTAAVNAQAAKTHRRAILAGDFYASASFPPKLGELNLESYNALISAFPIAQSSDYVPKCTSCNANVINNAAQGSPPDPKADPALGTWSTFALLSGIPITDVVSSEVVLTEGVTPYTLGSTGDAGVDGGSAVTVSLPLSPFYGFRTVLTIRP
jgi:hypothetical protein